MPLRLPIMGQDRILSLKEELKSYQFWKAIRCEFLVTLLYVFIGCGSTTLWHERKQAREQAASGSGPISGSGSISGPGPVAQVCDSDIGRSYHEMKIALSFGLAAATLVQCVGHISGAHINPAVTMAMLVTRNISVLRSVFYIIAQCIGGIAGAGILYGLTPKDVHGDLGVTQVHEKMGLGQAFGVEFMITFIVVFTVFANLDPKRADMGSRSLAIGLSVALGHLVAVSILLYTLYSTAICYYPVEIYNGSPERIGSCIRSTVLRVSLIK